MKTCPKCGEEKSLTDYYAKQGYCKRCGIAAAGAWAKANREARASAQRSWRAQNSEAVNAGKRAAAAETRERLSNLKLSAGCADCGYRAHPDALHFDHLPGFSKKFTVAHGLMRSWAAIEAEVAKCDVVCANCHAVRTAVRRHENAGVGTLMPTALEVQSNHGL